MDNVSKPKHRGIAIRPERWRYLLQLELMALYRAWQPYENQVLARLRPCWRRLENRYGWDWRTDLSTVELEAEDQIWREEDDGIPADDDVRHYLDSLNTTVATVMGMFRHGEAAPWARMYVHLDAGSKYPVSAGLALAHADFPVWERVSVVLHVTEDGARIERMSHSGESHAEESIESSFMTSFSEWETLRMAAHSVVDKEIDRIRDRFESGYTSNYAARLKGNRKDLPLLRAAMTATSRNRPVHDDATWKRLERLAAMLDLDSPRR